MGDSLPGFGELDLGLDSEDEPTQRRAIPPTAHTFAAAEEIGGEPPPPPSTSRVFGPPATRPTSPTRSTSGARPRPNTKQNTDQTRVMPGDVLATITGHPPPLEEEAHTRAWIEVDEAPVEDVSTGSSSSSNASGVASRDGRVAAMRELYARGDADGALALAASLGDALVPGALGDHPDASIVVEFGEQSIDLADAFGGRVPSDEAPTAIGSAPPPPSRRSSRAAMAGQAHSAPPPGLPPPPPRASQPVPRSLPPQVITVPPGTPQLSLTERQSIPRLLKSMGEVSKLPIDHRAGFLLAHVDGMQTLEEILDVCAMPAAEALDVIAKLKGMGVIEFE